MTTIHARLAAHLLNGAVTTFLIVLLPAGPAGAQLEPAPPAPDPWWCVDLSGGQAPTPAETPPAGVRWTPTTASAAVLGGVSGVVFVGGGLGAAAVVQRRRREDDSTIAGTTSR
ncbi:MAG: hypothetical protein ACXWDI_09055 [Nocardioides sp.]